MPKPKAGILTPLLRVKTGPVTAGDAILYVDMCECGGGSIRRSSSIFIFGGVNN